MPKEGFHKYGILIINMFAFLLKPDKHDKEANKYSEIPLLRLLGRLQQNGLISRVVLIMDLGQWL